MLVSLQSARSACTLCRSCVALGISAVRVACSAGGQFEHFVSELFLAGLFDLWAWLLYFPAVILLTISLSSDSV